MEREYIALITGPEPMLKNGFRLERFTVTDDDISEFLEEEDLLTIPTVERAIEYYKEEYVAEWEQRFCNVTLMTMAQFTEIFNESGKFIVE